ncbi:hypothetical protein T03_1838 [Trichinella britovi]|uniref:Uncharacterized protein n=1 Tax=Trichinella britovi TaxID=45882 RepID=A0A0V1CM89_TRIBR|nr:hypothetical protein T03_1838 [Trichinella britovi]
MSRRFAAGRGMLSGGRSGLPPAPFPLESCVIGRYSSPTFSGPDMVLPSGRPISFSRAPGTTLGRLVRTHVHEPFCPSITFVGAAPALLWLGLCRTPARVPGAVAGRIPQWSPPACPEAARTQHPLVVSAPSRILSGRIVDGTLWFWSWLCQVADTPLLSHQPRSYGPGLSAASLVLRNDRKCRSPAPWPPCPPRHQAVGRPQATLKSNRTPPRCSDCRVEFLLVAPPSPSPLAGRASQPGGSASVPAAFWSVPPGRRKSGTPDTSPLRLPAAVASKTVGVPAQCLRHSQVTARLLGCFFRESSATPFLLPYPVLPTHDTGFRPAASAGPVVTRGFGTCDSPPVVLGASPSCPPTPEFFGAPAQRTATPGSARSVPVSWPPLPRLRLDSWLRTACRLVGTGRQRSGVVVQAGGQLRIRTLLAAPASGLPALQVPANS